MGKAVNGAEELMQLIQAKTRNASVYCTEAFQVSILKVLRHVMCIRRRNQGLCPFLRPLEAQRKRSGMGVNPVHAASNS